LCDRVAFINEGRLVACDTPGRLKLQLGQRRLKVGCRTGGDLWLNLDDPADATRLQGLIAAGEVVTLHSQEATLEDVYLELTGRKLEAR
jgi:ABC-type multidrug transport system ATPase subunit